MYPLTKVERNIAFVTALALAVCFERSAFPGVNVFIGGLLYLLLFNLADFGLQLFLLLLKNGGGWPDL